MSKLGLSQERWVRVIRTFKQAVYGLVLTTLGALVVNFADVAKVEFGKEVWWPIASTLLTAVAAYLMHLKETKKG